VLLGNPDQQLYREGREGREGCFSEIQINSLTAKDAKDAKETLFYLSKTGHRKVRKQAPLPLQYDGRVVL
jgi:hypothetical protein